MSTRTNGKRNVSPEKIRVRTEDAKAPWLNSSYYFLLPNEDVVEVYMDMDGGARHILAPSHKFYSCPDKVVWLDVPEIYRKEIWYHLRGRSYKNMKEEVNFIHFGDTVTIHALLHNVHSEPITKQLMMELGYFQEIRPVRKIVRFLEMPGYANKVQYMEYHYVIDEKHFVTVTEKYYEDYNYPAVYSIDPYGEIKKDNDIFGVKAGLLSERSGIPWEIAIFLSHLNNEDEIEKLIIELISARGKVSEEIAAGLGSDDFGKMNDAIHELLGTEIWMDIDCYGIRELKKLTNFLLAKF